MRRSLLSLTLALSISTVTTAAHAGDTKTDAKADAKKTDSVRGGADDDDEDDILAPVRSADEKPASAVPVKAKDLKVGFLPIVPIGDASKTLGDQLTSEVIKAFNESATVEVVALQMNSCPSTYT